jgi:hypothetical protein
MTKKLRRKGAKGQTTVTFLGSIETIEAEELVRRLRGSDQWNSAEKRRAQIFQEIVRSLSAMLGPDADLEREVMDAINIWAETVELEDAPHDLITPLELLLGEHYNIGVEMSRLRNDLCRLR